MPPGTHYDTIALPAPFAAGGSPIVFCGLATLDGERSPAVSNFRWCRGQIAGSRSSSLEGCEKVREAMEQPQTPQAPKASSPGALEPCVPWQQWSENPVP